MARWFRRENIDLQARKIREIAEALIAAGYLCLDDQANVLGLPRSTTWTILHAKHKNSGLSASVIKQILAQPQLPNPVRRKVLEYVEQKSSGVYGHNPQRVRRFASGQTGLHLDGEHRLSVCRPFELTNKRSGSLSPDSTTAGRAIASAAPSKADMPLGCE